MSYTLQLWEKPADWPWPATKAEAGPSRAMILLMAVACGLTAANLYYAQPLIGLIDTMGKAYVPGLAGLAVFAMMALVLLWRPTGLFVRA